MRKRARLAAVVGTCCIAATAALVGATTGATEDGDVVTLTTSLNGAEQCGVNAPCGDPDGIGQAKIKLYPSKNQVCFTIRHENIEPANAGHIHLGPPGVTNPTISVNLYFSLEGVPSRISDCVVADPVTIGDIIANPTAYYVSEHNSEYVPGVLRGQLGD